MEKIGTTFTNEYKITQEKNGFYYLWERPDELSSWNRVEEYNAYMGTSLPVASREYDVVLKKLMDIRDAEYKKHLLNQIAPRTVFQVKGME